MCRGLNAIKMQLGLASTDILYVNELFNDQLQIVVNAAVLANPIVPFDR